jgi:S-adenosylmethionine-dependent methyltransferase
VAGHLRDRWTTIGGEDRERLRDALKTNYFESLAGQLGPVDAFLASRAGADDMDNHLAGRLTSDREIVVPWLDSIRSLADTTVLEIGAGTGASTVALAEQGADVVGIDPHREALTVAEQRLSMHGLSAVLEPLTFEEWIKVRVGQSFDWVIFFASLEHMPVVARVEALRAAWELLKAGGHLVVIETPNRLWYRDSHTSLALFFHWLPDDLALRYASRTARDGFNNLPASDPAAMRDALVWWGRGVSYHEFELALGVPAQDLPLVSCLAEHDPRMVTRAAVADVEYARFLSIAAPWLPAAFRFENLDLALLRA